MASCIDDEILCLDANYNHYNDDNDNDDNDNYHN